LQFILQVSYEVIVVGEFEVAPQSFNFCFKRLDLGNAVLKLLKLLLLIFFQFALLFKSFGSLESYSLQLCFHSSDELQKFFLEIGIHFVHSFHTVIL